MALLKWTKEYSVGVRILDEQHGEFVRCLNELHAAMLRGKAQSVASVIEPEMLRKMNQHFSTEEKLMEDTEFPGLTEHRAKHRALTAKAEEFVARYKFGDNTMYPELLRFVGEWFHNHTMSVDKQYTQWLNEHGVH